MDPPPPAAGRNRNFSWLHKSLQLPAVADGHLKVLGFVALLNALLFGLFFAVATLGYETNDDLSMQLIASGFYTGQPSEYLVFTNVLIGWALRLLYGLWNGNNWYIAYLVACHYASLTAIAFLILSRRRSWSIVLLYAGFFLLVEPRILLNLQFTTTAFLAGTAGVFLLVDGLEIGRPTRWSRVISGVVMITLMGMIREAVVPLLAIIAFPFLLERFGLRGWRRLFGAALVCGALFVVMIGINHWYCQRDPAWAEFLEYNKLRGKVHGTPLARFVSRAAPAAGWSDNDAQMFAQYYFAEPEVYADGSKLGRFVETLEGFAPSKFNLRDFSVSRLYLPMTMGRDSRILSCLALLNGAWCLSAAGTSRRRCFITLVVMYGVSVLLAFYLWETARFPARVSYNIPLFMHIVCLYWATGFGKSQAASPVNNAFSGRFSVLQRAGVLSWLALYVYCLSELSQNMWYANTRNHNLKKISRKIFEPLQALLPAGAQPLLIPMPVNSVLEQCLLYRHSVDAIPFHLVPYGWPTHSPLFRQILNRHRLVPYSLSLVDRRDVFFLMEERWLEPLRVFYREHYGLDIWFETVLNTNAMPQYRDFNLFLYQAHAEGGGATNRITP